MYEQIKFVNKKAVIPPVFQQLLIDVFVVSAQTRGPFLAEQDVTQLKRICKYAKN